MADEQKQDPRTQALEMDALVALAQAGVRVSEKGKTAPDAPRDPMATAAKEMAQCAIENTNADVQNFGVKAFDAELIQEKDRQHLSNCVEDFARNVRLADNAATNNLPKGNNGGRER